MIIMYIAFIEFLCYNRSRGELQKHTFLNYFAFLHQICLALLQLKIPVLKPVLLYHLMQESKSDSGMSANKS